MSKYLPKSWRLVMLDMPGHGESGFQPEGDYTARGMAVKLNRVRWETGAWHSRGYLVECLVLVELG